MLQVSTLCSKPSVPLTWALPVVLAGVGAAACLGGHLLMQRFHIPHAIVCKGAARVQKAAGRAGAGGARAAAVGEAESGRRRQQSTRCSVHKHAWPGSSGERARIREAERWVERATTIMLRSRGAAGYGQAAAGAGWGLRSSGRGAASTAAGGVPAAARSARAPHPHPPAVHRPGPSPFHTVWEALEARRAACTANSLTSFIS